MNGELRSTIDVSYTHLDVYKRQRRDKAPVVAVLWAMKQPSRPPAAFDRRANMSELQGLFFWGFLLAFLSLIHI